MEDMPYVMHDNSDELYLDGSSVPHASAPALKEGEYSSEKDFSSSPCVQPSRGDAQPDARRDGDFFWATMSSELDTMRQKLWVHHQQAVERSIRSSRTTRAKLETDIKGEAEMRPTEPTMDASNSDSRVLGRLSNIDLVLRPDWSLSDEDVVRAMPCTGNMNIQEEGSRVLSEMSAMKCWGQNPHGPPKSHASSQSFSHLSVPSVWDAMTVTWPLNPHSRYRLVWDLLGLVLILYETLTIPLQVLVLPENTPLSNLISKLGFALSFFWLLNMLLTLNTSTYVNGELCMNYRVIAMHYAGTWLVLDVLTIMCEWLAFFISTQLSGFVLIRMLKGIRLVRLLRLLRFESMLREQLRRVSSQVLLNTVYILKMIGLFLILNHFVACTWYFIGSSTYGWLREFAPTDPADIDVELGYLMALHWSITQFHGDTEIIPATKTEWKFAMVTLVIGMFTISVFGSFITDMILRASMARKRRIQHKQNLQAYFKLHQVSTQLMMRVKAYMDYREELTTTAPKSGAELFSGLPVDLQKSVFTEVRSQIVDGHPLFAWTSNHHPAACREMCYSAFESTHVLADIGVFSWLDACSQMYFVESGILRYQQGKVNRHRRMGSLLIRQFTSRKVGVEMAKGNWLCEPAVWVQNWQNRGEMFAISNSSLLLLESKRFVKVVRRFPVLFFDIALYARWALLELEKDDLTDLWRPDTEHRVSRASIVSMQSRVEELGLRSQEMGERSIGFEDLGDRIRFAEEMNDGSGDVAEWPDRLHSNAVSARI